MVESQLISDPNPNMPKLLDELIALQFFNEIKIDNCRHCSTPLPKKEIYHYQHPSGWIVSGYEKKQWLFIVCPKCNHQWSLWKLGFSRDTKIKPIPFEHQNDDPDYDPLIGSKLDLEMQIQSEKDKLLEIETNQTENPCNYDNLLLRDKSELEKEVQLLMFDKVNLQSEIANLKLEKAKLTGK